MTSRSSNAHLDEAERWRQPVLTAYRQLESGTVRSVELLAPSAASERTAPKVVLAGSFNPLHAGHCLMAELARQLTGLPVHFELSIENADKPPLDAGETARRLVPPFANREPAPRFSPNGFVLTRLPTFADKASEFSGAVFAVGIDTWKRIGDAAFYPTGGLQAAIEFIANSGCQFLVFGRKAADAFDDPETVMCRGDFPQSLVKLSIPVSESRFRVDLSSSRLRRNHAPGASE